MKVSVHLYIHLLSEVTNQVKSLKEAISDVVFVNKLDHAVTENFDLVALFVESSESLDTLVGPILQSLKPNGKLSLTVSGKGKFTHFLHICF